MSRKSSLPEKSGLHFNGSNLYDVRPDIASHAPDTLGAWLARLDMATQVPSKSQTLSGKDISAIKSVPGGEVNEKHEPEHPDLSLIDFCAQLDDYTPTVCSINENIFFVEGMFLIHVMTRCS